MSGWEIPRHWRLKKQRYSLVGKVCPHCDHKIFPPRDVCPNCGAEAHVTIATVAADEKGDTTLALALRQNVVPE